MPEPEKYTKHCCFNIEGVLCNLRKKKLEGLFKYDDGTPVPAATARKHLKKHLTMGGRVLPYGECDNFDYETGCKGHPAESSQQPSYPACRSTRSHNEHTHLP